jgi:hypothetical protein
MDLLGLKKLYKKHKTCKQYRNSRRIRPMFNITIDDSFYAFSFLPTIIWQPWMFRYNNSCIIDITWLNIHISIGKWEAVINE